MAMHRKELTLPICYQMYKHLGDKELGKHIQTPRSAGCIYDPKKTVEEAKGKVQLEPTVKYLAARVGKSILNSLACTTIKIQNVIYLLLINIKKLK